MSTLDNSVNKYRQELLSGNDKAIQELVRAHQKTWLKLKPELDTITKKYWDAVKSGKKISPSWLFRQERYQSLMRQTEEELKSLAKLGAQITNSEVSKALKLGEKHAQQLTLDVLGTPPKPVVDAGYGVRWDKLPKNATEKIVGYLQDGSPVKRLLNRYSTEAAQGIKDGLITGISTGKNPNVIAVNLKREFGANLQNITTVCRTETLRVYRQTQLDSYKNNKDVVDKWVWHSDKSSRTCLTCVLMHGEVFDLDQELNDHPNGRCSRVPKTKTWAELFPDVDMTGISETSIQVPKGLDTFKDLPIKSQQELLGKTKYAAYKDGKLDINDVIGVKKNKDFGDMPIIRTLGELNI